MSKQFYCAKCGTEVLVLRKVVPSQQKIVNVIRPHECLEGDIKLPFKIKQLKTKPKTTTELDKMFDGFEFVKKLNGLEPKDKLLTPIESGDKRPKEDLRQSSTAPKNLLESMKGMSNTPPERTDMDIEEGD